MNIDKAHDAIIGALAFFDGAHPTRSMLIERAQLCDSKLTEQKLTRTLTAMICCGEVVAYEEDGKCLFKRPEQPNERN